MIIDSSYKIPPFTPATNTEADKRLLVGKESAEWFRDHKVKCVGFGDGVRSKTAMRMSSHFMIY